MIKRLLLVLLSFLLFHTLYSQLLTWTPAFPKDNDNISITVDATKGNQGLQNYNPVSDVYVHTGVITNHAQLQNPLTITRRSPGFFYLALKN